MVSRRIPLEQGFRRPYLNAAKNLARQLGIKIKKVQSNIGGYQGGREQSYTYSVEETDPETLDLFGSLVSDLAFEAQDSTITGQYVSQDSDDFNAVEYFIECDTQNKHDMADIIEKLEFEAYTITSNGIQILYFDYDTQETNKDLEKRGHHHTQQRFDLLLHFQGCHQAGLIDGYLTVDLAAKTKNISYEDAQREYLTMEELNVLAATPCASPVLKRAVLFSALTGLRRSDIQKLKWRDVVKDEEHYRLLFTQQKTKGVEYMPISDQATNYAASGATLTDWCLKACKTRDGLTGLYPSG